MAQRVEPPNPLQEVYACLLSNGLDGSGFYPSALERGSRSEQSVNLALAKMYVQGVSTRKVINCAVLVAVGVTESGHRRVLGVHYVAHPAWVEIDLVARMIVRSQIAH